MAKRARHDIAGVIGHQHKRRFPVGVVNRDWRWLVRRQ
jgi:hypothetical protein